MSDHNTYHDDFTPFNLISDFIHKTVREATDKQVEDCFWLTYEDDGPIADAFTAERRRRGTAELTNRELEGSIAYDEEGT